MACLIYNMYITYFPISHEKLGHLLVHVTWISPIPVSTKHLYNIYTEDVASTLYKCYAKCFVFTRMYSNGSHPCKDTITQTLAQFSIYVHKGGLKPHSFHFPDTQECIHRLCMLDSRLSLITLLCHIGLYIYRAEQTIDVDGALPSLLTL